MSTSHASAIVDQITKGCSSPVDSAVICGWLDQENHPEQTLMEAITLLATHTENIAAADILQDAIRGHPVLCNHNVYQMLREAL